MIKPNPIRVSGTRFLNDDSDGHERVSLSASFRGKGHAITGETRTNSTEAIDAVAGERSLAVCAPATRKLAEELFNRWNNALKSLDARRVAECYADDAVLLPTVSNIPRTNRDEITDYFVHFLEKKPVGFITHRTVRLGCNKITDAGTYTFRVELADGSTADVPARYTFVYENHHGQWLISHHHSSAMPS
ncbi:MAG: DUF4440 domain-containing protein [Halothiobacillus sp. 14-55-98]|nr:MAG: DUF4440 domain-containing protein [Halothiobacillus sp. 14-55-98]